MTQWGLDTLFNPAKRHMDDEKRRLQSTREEVGDSSGGKRIDLESGKVVIRRDDADPEADGAPSGAAGDSNDANGAPEATAGADPHPAPANETPAQARARARRAAGKAAKTATKK
jgi:uncharacterized protein DUF6191